MKRAAMLYCADIDAPRYKVLKQRDQLPFAPSSDEADGKWADFTLDHAFRLRLMLDLIGGESNEEMQLAGLGPAFAAAIVTNVLPSFPRHPLNQIEPNDWWAGLVVFEDTSVDGESRRFCELYIGELERLGSWVEQERRRDRAGFDGAVLVQRLPVVRIFLANVTRAAWFVRNRAEELGIAEGMDFSEVQP